NVHGGDRVATTDIIAFATLRRDWRHMQPDEERPARKCSGPAQRSGIARISALRGVPHPIVDLAFGLLLGVAVALLQTSREFLALAVDAHDVIVGELTPLLAQLALGLHPITFDLVPVHH